MLRLDPVATACSVEYVIRISRQPPCGTVHRARGRQGAESAISLLGPPPVVRIRPVIPLVFGGIGTPVHVLVVQGHGLEVAARVDFPDPWPHDMAMRYLSWDERGASGLAKQVPGLAQVWTEVDDAGAVRRELGFDAEGHIAHRFPSDWYRHGTYGLFDSARIEVAGTEGDIEPAEFERRWDEVEFEPDFTPEARVSPSSRLGAVGGCGGAAAVLVIVLVAAPVLFVVGRLLMAVRAVLRRALPRL